MKQDFFNFQPKHLRHVHGIEREKKTFSHKGCADDEGKKKEECECMKMKATFFLSSNITSSY